MKILVCVKIANGEINPFDESALECALGMSDDVTAVCMGPKSCEDALKALTRLGARAILISDSLYTGSDTLATSYILSSAIKGMEYDLILCGRQSIDGDTAQVGPMLSQMLGVSLITNAMKVEAENGIVTAETRCGRECAELPSLVTVERGYVLRFPSIFSKTSEVSVIDNSVVGCEPSRCGLEGSPTRVLEAFENERGKRKCKFISFSELDSVIKKSIEKDRETEKKVLQTKLKKVWIVGDKVYEKASEIADKVYMISESDPKSIAEEITKNKAEIVLWNADLWGRKNAPIVAAMLSTGLCADCTHLETDGKSLFMYRPAQGGNITAKIKCLTTPQMATVRTVTAESDIVVSGGRGVSKKIEKLTEFCQKYKAAFGASRGLVDTGKVPYEHQVGLTGKAVSPAVYIAVGISGAVHHTCAIEGAGTVIAINPDKNARIFEYADYGIVEEF